MSVTEIENALDRRLIDSIFTNPESMNNADKYCARLYMGVITSRNLVLIFDKDKKLSFYTWGNT